MIRVTLEVDSYSYYGDGLSRVTKHGKEGAIPTDWIVNVEAIPPVAISSIIRIPLGADTYNYYVLVTPNEWMNLATMIVVSSRRFDGIAWEFVYSPRPNSSNSDKSDNSDNSDKSDGKADD